MKVQKKLVRITTIPGSIGILLKGQLAYMSSKYEVIAIASSEPKGSLQKVADVQGVRAIPVQMTRKITPFRDLMAIYRLYRILRKEKPLFVHTHTPKAGLVGMAAAYLARVPFRMHDIAGLPLLVARGFKRKILEWVERTTYAMATHVYPNSHRMRDIAIDLNFAKPEKLKVLGHGSSNGVNTKFFDPAILDWSTVEKLKNKLGIAPKDFVFVFIGRLVGDKGINELLQAFTALHKRVKSTKLLLVGVYEPELDPIRPETEKAIENHPAVKYVGGQADVRPYLGAADALTFPTYREGFPNVPMEAGSMGIPCIVTDINGCNEIVKHGKNGLIIPPRDAKALEKAMEQIYTDELLRKKLSENARPMVAERYEQEEVWKYIMKEYQELEQSSLFMIN